MSPLTSSESAVQSAAQGNGSSRIIHFDATIRRKEKMRLMAAKDQALAATTAPPAPAAIQTAPPRPTQPAAAPVLPQQPAFASPSPAPAAPVVQAAAPTPPAAAPAPAPTSPAPAAATPAAPAMSPAELETFLVNFVVEQTGYPPEMVELDADLEADLGIDSIKKAQLFGELAEYFEVQVTGELSLDDFPTLRHVVNFLKGVPQKGAAPAGQTPSAPPAVTAPQARTAAPAAPAMSAAPAPAAPAAPAAASAGNNGASAKAAASAPTATAAPLAGQDLEQFLVNFVVEQTGYPPEMVELDADLEADLGIDSIKKAQLFGELAEYFEVQVTGDLSLDDFPTLRHVLNFLRNVPPKGAGPAPAAPTSAGTAAAAPAAAYAPAPTAPAAAPAAPAAAVVPTPQPAPAPQPAASGNGAPHAAKDVGDLEQFLVNFVVEQTGYPPEMVELDADLEADLGIDSIKKAQLFGELAEYFEVQVTGDLSLDDFPTLRHVLKFLEGVPRKMPV